MRWLQHTRFALLAILLFRAAESMSGLVVYPGFSVDGGLRDESEITRRNATRSLLVPRTVPVVADLATLAPFNGQEVRTTGYSTSGDGGGNSYTWVAGDTTTHDGGFFINDGNNVGRWIAKNRTLANPRQFGASGVKADNQTVQVQAAVSAGVTHACAVYFPPGGYTVDGLTAGAPSFWHGDGTEKSIIWASDTATGAFITDTGNAAKFTMRAIGLYGQPTEESPLGNPTVTSVVRLGHNTYPWGSNGILNDIRVSGFPAAKAFDNEVNVVRMQNIYIVNCGQGVCSIGNALSLHKVDIVGSRTGPSLEIAGPCRLVDIEIEGHNAGGAVARFYTDEFRSEPHITGMYITLPNSGTPGVDFNNPTTLFDWEERTGSLQGFQFSAGVATYDNFITGAATSKTPFEFNFTAYDDVVFPDTTVDTLRINSLSAGSIDAGQLSLRWDGESTSATVIARNSDGVARSGLLSLSLRAGEFDGTQSAILKALTAITGTEYTYAWSMHPNATGGMIAGKNVDGNAYLGYLNSATELLHKCNVGGSNYMRATMPSTMLAVHTYMLRRNGDGNDFDVWQDDVAATVDYVGTVPNNPLTIDLIGRNHVGSELDGQLWLLRAWDRAFTDPEKTAYFASGTVPDDGLVLDLQFADGAGTQITDFSPEKNHGTGTMDWATR